MGKTNTHTSRSFYFNIIIRIGWCIKSKNKGDSRTVQEITNNIITTTPNKKRIRELLYCKWCKMQDERCEDDKIRLGEALKGNSRHLHLFCDHEEIKSLRKDVSNDIEFKLWNVLDIMQGSLCIHELREEVNAFLYRLRTKNIGRLDPDGLHKNNYLSVKDWLNFCDLINIQEGRKKNM